MSASDWVSLTSLLVAIGSLWFTYKQWQKTNAKIAMLTSYSKAAEVLPAWYTVRMMGDYWLFGLLTSDGKMIVINQIVGVSDDANWLDVELASRDDYPDAEANCVLAISPERTRASVSIRNIVAAIELRAT